MTRFVCFLAVLSVPSVTWAADESQAERDFERMRPQLVCINGSTSEPSCGGTDMDVWLQGEEIHKLDWWVEKSNQWVREEYYFRGSRPILVIETVEAKYDEQGESLKRPRLVSRTKYRLDDAGGREPEKKFLEHAEFLIRDFRERRSEFALCARPH
jgi:hypothetical protein